MPKRQYKYAFEKITWVKSKYIQYSVNEKIKPEYSAYYQEYLIK